MTKKFQRFSLVAILALVMVLLFVPQLSQKASAASDTSLTTIRGCALGTFHPQRLLNTSPQTITSDVSEYSTTLNSDTINDAYSIWLVPKDSSSTITVYRESNIAYENTEYSTKKTNSLEYIGKSGTLLGYRVTPADTSKNTRIRIVVTGTDGSSSTYYFTFNSEGALKDKSTVDKEEAAAVDTLIDAIGTVTADSAAKVTAAENAYNILSDDQKKLVTKKDTLDAAKKALDGGSTEPETKEKTLIKSLHANRYTSYSTSSSSVYAITPDVADGVTEYTGKLTGNHTSYSLWVEPTETNATVKVYAEANVSYSSTTYSSTGDNALASAGTKNNTIKGFKITPRTSSKNAKVKIVITSADGTTTGTYYVTFQRETSVKDKATWDQEEAEYVDGLIDKIGTVTASSKTAINNAQNAYNVLTDDQKKLVSKKDTLDAAKEALPQAQIQDVIDKIDAIGEVTLKSSNAISNARYAYNNLSEEQKAKVTNYETLTKAEATLDELKAKDCDDAIDAIGEVVLTDECKKLINTARAKYNVLTTAQKKLVTKLDALEAAEAKYQELRYEKPAGSIYICYEKGTIGQGYLQEPTKVEYYKDETLADVMMRIDNTDGNVDITYSPNTSYGFYMTGVNDPDGSLTATFPAYITEYAANNSMTLSDTRANEHLGEFDYSSWSGWVYSFNNVHAPVGASSLTVSDGMVIRWAFTVVGYGSDCWNTGWGSAIVPVAVDRSAMIKTMAEYRANVDYEYLSSVKGVKEAYSNLLALGNDYTASQETVDNLTTALTTEINKAYAQKVIDQIDAIGEVTAESGDAITKAREAYDGLTDVQKEYVSNYETLTKAEQVYPLVVAAAPVIQKIDDIGEVTLNSKKTIDAARTAYDALTAEEQAYVTNYDTLTKAEKTYEILAARGTAIQAMNKAAEEESGKVSDEGKSKIEVIRALAEEEINETENFTKMSNLSLKAIQDMEAVTTAEELAKKEAQAEAAAKAAEELQKTKEVAQNELVKYLNDNYINISKEDGLRDTLKYVVAIGSAQDAEEVAQLLEQGKAAINKRVSSYHKSTKLAKTKITSLKSKKGKKSFTVKWKKISNTTGYQVCYAKAKTFKGKKTLKVRGDEKVTKTVKKLKRGKTYYVKVRSYKNYNGKTYYSSWSAVKKVKIK